LQGFVVAIDGPAGAGKSTVSKALAGELGYTLLDTGAIYRSVAWVAQQEGVGWDDGSALGRLAEALDIRFSLDANGLNRVTVRGTDLTQTIRTAAISEGASIVSAHSEVRSGLLSLQRSLAETSHVVAEGRDIGTVVFPDAPVKFFLTASEAIRARRRSNELVANGQAADLESVRKDMSARDRRDSQRALAPLKAAEDAIMVDSSGVPVADIVRQMSKVVRARGG